MQKIKAKLILTMLWVFLLIISLIEHVYYKQPMSVWSAFIMLTILQVILYSSKNDKDAK